MEAAFEHMATGLRPPPEPGPLRTLALVSFSPGAPQPSCVLLSLNTAAAPPNPLPGQGLGSFTSALASREDSSPFIHLGSFLCSPGLPRLPSFWGTSTSAPGLGTRWRWVLPRMSAQTRTPSQLAQRHSGGHTSPFLRVSITAKGANGVRCREQPFAARSPWSPGTVHRRPRSLSACKPGSCPSRGETARKSPTLKANETILGNMKPQGWV